MSGSTGRLPVPTAPAGFTLVEALLAIVLLCTGLLATAALGSVSVHAWRRAGELTAAVVAAGEAADSFGILGVVGEGSRQYPWGTLAWDDPVPLGGRLVQVTIRASARDTARAELLRVVATVPVP